MNENYDNELETRIDRELKSLPPLAAPRTLAPRVMSAIASRAVVPWYRRAWQTWPVALRAASFVALLALFGGMCFAGWELSHGASVAAATQKVGGVFSIVSVACRILSVLGDAVTAVLHHLGTGFILALVAVVLFAYAACVGLGSAAYRLAFARR